MKTALVVLALLCVLSVSLTLVAGAQEPALSTIVFYVR